MNVGEVAQVMIKSPAASASPVHLHMYVYFSQFSAINAVSLCNAAMLEVFLAKQAATAMTFCKV